MENNFGNYQKKSDIAGRKLENAEVSKEILKIAFGKGQKKPDVAGRKLEDAEFEKKILKPAFGKD